MPEQKPDYGYQEECQVECQTVCQKGCQIECQTRCQTESQKEYQIKTYITLYNYIPGIFLDDMSETVTYIRICFFFGGDHSKGK